MVYNDTYYKYAYNSKYYQRAYDHLIIILLFLSNGRFIIDEGKIKKAIKSFLRIDSYV